MRLEPGTLGIHQRDHRDGTLRQIRGEPGDVVETGLAGRVQHVIGAQGRETVFLGKRHQVGKHRGDLQRDLMAGPSCRAGSPGQENPGATHQGVYNYGLFRPP